MADHNYSILSPVSWAANRMTIIIRKSKTMQKTYLIGSQLFTF